MRAAGTTDQPRCGQFTATIPGLAPTSLIVSLLVSDGGHIAAIVDTRATVGQASYWD